MKEMKLFLKGFQQGMKSFGAAIAMVVNSLLLTIVYLLGVGIVAILSRIFGKRFLNLNPVKGASYWQPLNLKEKPIEKYYRQF